MEDSQTHKPSADLQATELIDSRKSTFTRITMMVLPLLIFFAFSVTWYILSLNEPSDLFPTNSVIDIPEGLAVRDISELLEDMHVVKSSTYLETILRTQFSYGYIQAGTYQFPTKLSTQEVAHALTMGLYEEPPLSLTLPEGLHGSDMIPLIAEVLPELAEELTVDELDAHIGFLFPDTYFLEPDITADEFILRLRETYKQKTADLKEDIYNSSLMEDGVITLASIVEREGKSEESMRLVAGILWTRLQIGMPLQVDATLEFERGKGSAELTFEDLELDSPYNTYTNRGLPPTPIANPGLTAIKAVLDPIETEYLYYLTAPDGTFYYAETFEGHKRNKDLYLR